MRHAARLRAHTPSILSLLLVITMSLLNLISLNEWTLFLIVMIFLLYMSVYFLYKRRIRFTFHMAAGFALLAAMEERPSLLSSSLPERTGHRTGISAIRLYQMELYAPVDSVLSEENQQKLAEVNTRYGKEHQRWPPPWPPAAQKACRHMESKADPAFYTGSRRTYRAGRSSRSKNSVHSFSEIQIEQGHRDHQQQERIDGV